AGRRRVHAPRTEPLAVRRLDSQRLEGHAERPRGHVLAGEREERHPRLEPAHEEREPDKDDREPDQRLRHASARHAALAGAGLMSPLYAARRRTGGRVPSWVIPVSLPCGRGEAALDSHTADRLELGVPVGCCPPFVRKWREWQTRKPPGLLAPHHCRLKSLP